MFGYTIKKFIINWLIVLAVLMVGASAALGYSSLTGTIDLFAGFAALGDMFGGLMSLGGIAIVLLALAIITWGLHYMSKTDYTGQDGKRIAHIVIGLAIVVAAAFIGLRWININDDFWPTVWTLIGVIVIVTVATAFVTPRTKVAPKALASVDAHRADHSTSSAA